MNLPRRVSAGAAALIFFAMFFALPLYAAVTMCTMPCCHHGSAHATLKSNLPACPGNECVISADDATVKAVSRYEAPSLVATPHVPTTTVVVAAVHTRDIIPSPPPGAHDLQLLNTVFRI